MRSLRYTRVVPGCEVEVCGVQLALRLEISVAVL
jgi:hypothetical protein